MDTSLEGSQTRNFAEFMLVSFYVPPFTGLLVGKAGKTLCSCSLEHTCPTKQGGTAPKRKIDKPACKMQLCRL